MTLVNESTIVDCPDETTVLQLDLNADTATDIEEQDSTLILDITKEKKRMEREENNRLKTLGIRKRLPRACKGAPMPRFSESSFAQKEQITKDGVKQALNKVSKKLKQKDTKIVKAPKGEVIYKKKKKSNLKKTDNENTTESTESKEMSEESNQEIAEEKGTKGEEAKQLKRSTLEPKKFKKPAKLSVSFKSYKSSKRSEEPKVTESNTKTASWQYFDQNWVDFGSEDSARIENEYKQLVDHPKWTKVILQIGDNKIRFNFKQMLQTGKDKIPKSIKRTLI
ncbi:hypothetical protein EIN_344610 [Entamoeba invadens IP1]|uniref:WWE domain-containing protein n=1 Tax=Entamoeba invadens IP1 TaxID=370355 RepID=A0A0A1U377_ENTIV|nr:hypothetical protein EIN_344610 [Entamoeba invadens IP1]ELP88511.1 hypothetical protein EIN_344610 [Entamoeba invadens IP1]|eukprot:XP_004255282.1 hypothetical protein EIN_344610 [Entamoeba invadens IP1]